jgi:hypothetical protein
VAGKGSRGLEGGGGRGGQRLTGKAAVLFNGLSANEEKKTQHIIDYKVSEHIFSIME